MNEQIIAAPAPAPKINESIIAIMREVEAIGKERKNQSQGYNFRGIDDAMNALHNLFAKHCVFVTTEVLSQEREERQNKSGSGILIYSILRVRFTFHALDGSKVVSEIVGEGMDSGDKASNKALSVALKYALLQLFLIPTREFVDPEQDSWEPLPKDLPKPALPPTKPLPAGSFQTVPKVEDPAPTTKTPEKPGSAPKPATPAASEESGSQVIDMKHSRDWKSVVYSTGKGAKAKHKKFGECPEDFLDKLEAYYQKTPPKTTQDQMYAEALRWRREELDATEALPIDQLRALCAKDKIDERDILRVAQTELADGAKSLEEVSTDNITYLIDNWAQAKILADDIPA